MLGQLRLGVRTLGRAPGFTLATILILALGIGATTALFTLAYGVLVRPLPYADPGRLVMAFQDQRAVGGPPDEWASPGNVADWGSATDIFSAFTAASGWSPSLTGSGAPEQLTGAQVTGAYFDTLGVRPALGRTFRPDEDVPNAPRVAIISHELWLRRFGGDRSILERAVALGGDPHTIVGVLPPGFVPAIQPDAEIFRPLRLNLANPSRGAIFLRTIGRLRPGVTLDEARARADVLARRLETAWPRTNRGVRINLIPLQERVVGPVETPLLALLGASVLVLLIACANVANLSLARGLSRTREVAVRLALGASRGRVALDLLTESLLLSIAGGAAGVIVALWALRAFTTYAPVPPALTRILPGADAESTWPVLLFAAGLTMATTVLVGLIPALRVSRGAEASALRDHQRTATPASNRVRQALVVAEIALACVLVVNAGLLARSFERLRTFDLGFDPSPRTLAGRVVPAPAKYRTPEQLAALYDALLARASTIPGVSDAALTSILPVGGDSDQSLEIEGRPPGNTDRDDPVAWYRLVSSGHLRLMGIPLARGRAFGPTEPAPVTIVNQTMAARYWPGQDPIGRRVRTGPEAPWLTIVGIARDMRSRGPAESPIVEMYVPYRFQSERGMWILLQKSETGSSGATVSAASLAPALGEAVRSVDADLPVANIGTLEEKAALEVAQPRFVAGLTALFGTLALVLAAAGIYGVLAYSVAQRTAEIGVRMALGARATDVVWLIVGQATRLALVGVAVGVLGAVLAARGVRTLLFEVSPTDPVSFGLTMVLLALCAAAAAYLPARRATRVDPVVAMRSE
jgi:putative ABC transport system permease protein